MRIAAYLAALALSLIPLSAADAASRITTKDGNVIVGDIESLQDSFYTIRTPYGAMRIPAQSVDRIEPVGGAPGPAPAAGPAAAAPVSTSGPLRLAGSNPMPRRQGQRTSSGVARAKTARSSHAARVESSPPTCRATGRAPPLSSLPPARPISA